MIIFFVLGKINNIYPQKSLGSSIYIETNYSAIRKIQDNLIPYYYDHFGTAAFSTGYSAKFKNPHLIVPQIDIGITTFGYKLKHFEKIQDTVNSILLENWLSYRILEFKIGTTVNFHISRILFSSIGVNFNIPLFQREVNKTILINDLFSSQNVELNSNKKKVKDIKNLLINLRGVVYAKVSNRVSPYFLFDYGVSNITNSYAPDFLARQINVGFGVAYWFK